MHYEIWLRHGDYPGVQPVGPVAVLVVFRETQANDSPGEAPKATEMAINSVLSGFPPFESIDPDAVFKKVERPDGTASCRCPHTAILATLTSTIFTD